MCQLEEVEQQQQQIPRYQRIAQDATAVPSAEHRVVGSMDTSIPDTPLRTPPSQSQRSVLTKGMSFPDSKAALHFVQDIALAHNKRVKVASRGGNHRRVVCAPAAGGTAEAPCPFFVQLYQHKSKTDRTWYVSSFELTHATDCSSRGKPTQRQIAAMSQFQQALQQTPDATATQLLAKVEGGGNANLRTIYRAKQETKRALLDRLHASYSEIPSLLTSFMALNPGSLATYEADDEASEPSTTASAAKLFISCGVFTASTPLNQQIYGLECKSFAHKQSGLKGVQLFLFGKDSDFRTVTLAAAVCDAPSRASYKWFLSKIEQSGVKNLRVVPILVAKDSVLLDLEGELGLTLRYCTRSIIESDLAGFRGFKPQHHDLVWDLQQSENEEQFNERLEWIGARCGSAIESYLRHQIPVERWVVAGNIRKVSLYGWRSRDFHEPPGGSHSDESSARAPSKLIESLQDASLVTFLERVMAHFVESAFERSALATTWRLAGQIATARAAELYETQRTRSSEYDVMLASDTVAFVARRGESAFASSASPSSLTPVQRRHRVDLGVNSCTCAFLDQFAVPCRHLIAVLARCQQQSLDRRVCARFASGYLVENFALAFEGKRVELPLASVRDQQPDERSSPSASNRPATPAAIGILVSRSSSEPPRKLKRSSPKAASQDSSASFAMGKPVLVSDAQQPQAQKAQKAQQSHRTCRKCGRAGHNARSCASNLVQQPPGSLRS